MQNPIKNTLWVEKYRPQSLEEYVGNDALKATIQKYLDSEDIPHLLFYARAGTGKTTLAEIITHTLDCDVLYLNASDENSVDTIRNKIKSFVSASSFRKWRLVLLDEADYLTPNAQAVLRNMMEKFSKRSRFVMTCNYPEKIIDAIQSRCTVFEVFPPSQKAVAMRIAEILQKESVQYDIKDVGQIIKKNYPDIRRCISYTQQQVKDGKLVLDDLQKSVLDYLDKIAEILKNTKKAPKGKYREIRQIIADTSIRDFQDLFRYLYDNASEIAPEGKEGAMILKIAEAQRADALVVDKEISAVAMLIEIIAMQK